jgi:hypothetical protein
MSSKPITDIMRLQALQHASDGRLSMLDGLNSLVLRGGSISPRWLSCTVADLLASEYLATAYIDQSRAKLTVTDKGKVLFIELSALQNLGS